MAEESEDLNKKKLEKLDKLEVEALIKGEGGYSASFGKKLVKLQKLFTDRKNTSANKKGDSFER